MAKNKIRRIKTISEYHKLRNLPKPEHPLISIIDFETIELDKAFEPDGLVMDFYSMALKRNFGSKIKYGQQAYDFDEGVLFFMSPSQVFSVTPSEEDIQPLGWLLLVHPDFLWNTTLATSIKNYEFFDYAVNEALFLSDKEETTLISLFKNLQQDYRANLDGFSEQILIAQVELLLSYSDRYYNRQFLTRKKDNHEILTKLECLLSDYFSKENRSLPTVQDIANELNLSPNYLSSLLKTWTGRSTQEHIHEKIIERAKKQLSTTELSVSEIAFSLGFEHSQSFSKLFKTKTDVSPSEFRRSFN